MGTLLCSWSPLTDARQTILTAKEQTDHPFPFRKLLNQQLYDISPIPLCFFFLFNGRSEESQQLLNKYSQELCVIVCHSHFVGSIHGQASLGSHLISDQQVMQHSDQGDWQV